MQLRQTIIFGVLFFIIPIIGTFSTMPIVKGIDSHAPYLQDVVPNTSYPEPNTAVSTAEPQSPPSSTSSSAPTQAESPLAAQHITVQHSDTGEKLTFTPLEYTAGAIAAEMPPTFHPEALKAQGVAAHTYALCRALQENGPPLTANPAAWEGVVTREIFFQRYGKDAEAYWGIIESAAAEVQRVLLLHDDKPIVAAYHSMSSGKTEDAVNVWAGTAPYLIPVDSAGDKDAPDYRSQVTLDTPQAKAILASRFADLSLSDNPAQWFQILSRTPSNYVDEVQVGNHTLSGMEMRTLFNLRSASFTIQYHQDTGFTFEVLGYGHGVGMSQYGAEAMAQAGADYRTILQHYFPTAVLAP